MGKGPKKSILCIEVVLFSEVKIGASFIGRLSFSWRVLYQWFHCTLWEIISEHHGTLKVN